MSHPFAQWIAAAVLAATCGHAAGQLIIGQTAGFSGPVAAGVKETTDGARLYIDHVNTSGGIAGQRIELVSLDDKFDPKLAGENGKKLIEERNVIAMFLTRGTPHTEAILPLLTKHGVPLVAPSTGAMVLHEPVLKYVFNVRSTYQREAERIIRHLATMGVSRIAIVHADDSFGRDALEGAKRGFAAAEFQPVAVIRADRSKPDFDAIVKTIVEKQSQAVLWVASGNAVADGVVRLRSTGSVAQIITLSNNASAGFIKSMGRYAAGVVVSQVFPSERSVIGFVSEAARLAKVKGVELSPAMLEGFAAAKVLVEGLRRAGPKPTRATLLAGLESINQMDLGGLQLDYSATDHTGLNFVDLSIITEDGRFRR